MEISDLINEQDVAHRTRREKLVMASETLATYGMVMISEERLAQLEALEETVAAGGLLKEAPPTPAQEPACKEPLPRSRTRFLVLALFEENPDKDWNTPSLAAEISKTHFFRGKRPAHTMSIVLNGLLKKGQIVKTRKSRGTIPASYRLKSRDS